MYSLGATSNKRELIWTSFGQLWGTRPYQLENGEVISRDPFILFFIDVVRYMTLPSSSIKALPICVSPSEEVIYLPPCLPEVIYLPPCLPEVVYLPAPCLDIIPVDPVARFSWEV
jgi:hypothetical protein